MKAPQSFETSRTQRNLPQHFNLYEASCQHLRTPKSDISCSKVNLPFDMTACSLVGAYRRFG